MNESGEILRGTMVLTLGRVAGYGLSFLRNLILARMLTKADYGLAAVFGMIVSLLEVSGNMGFGLQVIQSKDGDKPGFQAAAHVLQFLGGVISATLIAGLSVPMAHFFNIPQDWWAFALLAIVPLSMGLGHLDVSRRQRELDYVPLVLVDVIPQFLITVAIWPLAAWLIDYRVILCLMIGKAILGSALTFAFSRRPYRWGWEHQHVRSMILFGWPMLLASMLIFGSQQLDQMLVGAVFSLNMLANYALAFSLASIPWFILGQVGAPLILPVLSKVQEDSEKFCRQYRVCADASAAAGVMVTLPLILVGEQLITLLYGGKYQGTGIFVAILGTAFALRFLRLAPAIAATARADTINHLYSNIWRGCSFPLALVVVALKGSPIQIAACAIIGELLAVIASMVRLRQRQGVPLRESLGASFYMAGMLVIGLGFALSGAADWSFWPAVAGAMAVCMVAFGSAWFFFPEMGRFILEALRRSSTAISNRATPN